LNVFRSVIRFNLWILVFGLSHWAYATDSDGDKIDNQVDDPDRFLSYLNPSSPLYNHVPPAGTPALPPNNTPEAIKARDTALAYYAAIDPLNEKNTFENWRTVNEFHSAVDVTDAIYINDADLGFGRHMYVWTRTDGSVISYVENFGNNENAVDPSDGNVARSNDEKIVNARDNPERLIATVAMEYSPPPDDPNGIKYVKFFTFCGPVLAAAGVCSFPGERVISANLDGRGEKIQPDVCNICHGGKPKGLRGDGVYPDHGNNGAQFLPWDVDTFVFSENDPVLSRQMQEAKFKKFNQAVLSTYPTGDTRSFTSTSGIDIPAGGYTVIDLPVSGVSGPINTLSFSFDTGPGGQAGFEHPDTGSINLKLYSPSGQNNTLITRQEDQFGGADYRETLITDYAGAQMYRAKPDEAPFTGAYKPTYSFSLKGFNGDDPNGTWLLRLWPQITAAPGKVYAWSLHFNGIPRDKYTPAAVELIEGWYGGPGLPADTFNGEFVPDGWLPPMAPANAQELYLEVLAPTCRACHVQRGSLVRPEIDFSTYDEFMSFAQETERLVYDYGVMPLALRTFQNRFWSSNQPVILGQHLPNFSHGLPDGSVLKPGRPIANAGIDRTTDPEGLNLAVPVGTPVQLNGKASPFASGGPFATKAVAFNWTLLSKPVGSATTLENAESAQPVFLPDVDGHYIFQLVVGIGATTSLPDEVTITASTLSTTVSFENELSSDFKFSTSSSESGCGSVACHGSNIGLEPNGFSFNTYDPNVPYDPNEAFNRARERVDVDTPLQSLLLTVPSGLDPHSGGVRPNFDLNNDDDLLYEAVLKWILDGANNN
jgi:Proprotein convertase P-domain